MAESDRIVVDVSRRVPIDRAKPPSADAPGLGHDLLDEEPGLVAGALAGSAEVGPAQPIYALSNTASLFPSGSRK